MPNLPMQFGCFSVIVTKDALKPEIILMLVIFGIEPSNFLRVDNKMSQSQRGQSKTVGVNWIDLHQLPVHCVLRK